MKDFMNNIFMLLLVIVTLTVSACSAPKPTKISFTNTRAMKPINFNDDITDNNIVIKSSKTRAYSQAKMQNSLSKQFVYSINEYQEYSPEFFYTVAHADKIIARIKPPFIDYVFSKVQSGLRDYGITTKLELFIEEEDNQNPQVILECIKFERKRNSFFNL